MMDTAIRCQNRVSRQRGCLTSHRAAGITTAAEGEGLDHLTDGVDQTRATLACGLDGPVCLSPLYPICMKLFPGEKCLGLSVSTIQRSPKRHHLKTQPGKRRIEKAPRTETRIRRFGATTCCCFMGSFLLPQHSDAWPSSFGIREETITSHPERKNEAWKCVDSSPLFRNKRKFVTLFSNFSDSGRFQFCHVPLAHSQPFHRFLLDFPLCDFVRGGSVNRGSSAVFRDKNPSGIGGTLLRMPLRESGKSER